VCKFRRLLEEHDLGSGCPSEWATFAAEGTAPQHRDDCGCDDYQDPISTKNARQERDPEMHQTAANATDGTMLPHPAARRGDTGVGETGRIADELRRCANTRCAPRTSPIGAIATRTASTRSNRRRTGPSRGCASRSGMCLQCLKLSSGSPSAIADWIRTQNPCL